MKRLVPTLVASAVMAMGLGIANADQSKSYTVVDGGIPKSLTGKPGDAATGRKVVINRRQGNCLACHTMADLKKHPFQGEIGPSLDGVAGRYNEAQLRLILVDSKKLFDGTIMPSFYQSSGFNRIMKKFADKSILTAKQVEDVIAYLRTQTE